MFAYNESMLDIVKDKVASMYEVAVNCYGYDIDDFSDILVNSDYMYLIEEGNLMLMCGKSALEILALVLGKDPVSVEISEFASPEYWTGMIIAVTSWYYSVRYKDIFSKIKASEIEKEYFPYHEMDIKQMLDFMKEKLGIENKLKKYRLERGLSQHDLAILSDVPVRSIRAYEQDSVQIENASGQTLYKLSKTLKCTIEDLLL